jgi:hypothetical protein
MRYQQQGKIYRKYLLIQAVAGVKQARAGRKDQH